MKIFNFKDFMKKYNFKDDIMNEVQFQKNYSYPICPRDSKLYSDKLFVNIANGRMRRTHWTCFIAKVNKSYYLDGFGGAAGKFFLNHLHKPIIFHNSKVQYINSELRGSYCLYFFYWIERIN